MRKRCGNLRDGVYLPSRAQFFFPTQFRLNLALLMPIEQATPVVVLMSVSIAGLILLQDWRNVHLQSAGHLIVSTVAGIPAGLWLLRNVPRNAVKGTLACPGETPCLKKCPGWPGRSKKAGGERRLTA